MNFLKGLAISLLSLILFFSLSLFGIVHMLGETFLNPDFITAEINRLDVPALAKDMFRMEAQPEAPYLTEVIDQTIIDAEPWIKEEVSTFIYSGYDYLMGRSEGLSLKITTSPLTDKLKENITEVVLASPPPEFKNVPQAVIRQYADQTYEQFDIQIPPTIEFSESDIPLDVMSRLTQVRSYLSYYQLTYYGLVILMVLCTLGIFLISRDVKQTTRSIGTTILTYGIIGYATTFAFSYFSLDEQLMGMTGAIPVWLQTWMAEFMDNVMAPLKTFNIALLITGIVLIVVSIAITIVYRQRQPETEAE